MTASEDYYRARFKRYWIQVSSSAFILRLHYSSFVRILFRSVSENLHLHLQDRIVLEEKY